MQSERKTEILVGIFLFVGLLMLGGIILQFGGLREWFTDTYTLRVAFPNASGIKEGSPVYLGGSKVGKVSRHPQLNETFNGILVDLKIRDDVDIPADAVFAIGSAGLMGDALIEIRPTSEASAEFLPHNHAEVIEGAKSGGLADLQSTAEQVGKKVEIVLDDMRSALKDVRESVAKINQEALSSATINDFKESMRHLNQTLARVDDKVLGDENADLLKDALADLREAAGRFKTSSRHVEEGTSKIGPLIDKLDPAVAKVDGIMSTAEDTLKSVKAAADAFAVTARKLQSGQGLLGALMNDAELKTDLKDLIANMKRNGVLFYRDSATRARGRSEDQPAPKPAPRPPFLGR
jgi:phospholipid/cholesterol/gamma-HCH transport system substrate-binding protein